VEGSGSRYGLCLPSWAVCVGCGAAATPSKQSRISVDAKGGERFSLVIYVVAPLLARPPAHIVGSKWDRASVAIVMLETVQPIANCPARLGESTQSGQVGPFSVRASRTRKAGSRYASIDL